MDQDYNGNDSVVCAGQSRNTGFVLSLYKAEQLFSPL